MEFLKFIFSPIIAVFKFINTYFKAMIFLLIVFLIFSSGESSGIKAANLAQINILGAIRDSSKILEEIHAASEDEHIKGVLLFIDSPGGALAPSTELAIAIKNLRAKKPVITYASGSMTSGSYYAGVNANKILANPGSFIGSIGVILQAPDISELANKIGVAQQVVKAGEFKEAGTFARKWNEAERAELQNLVRQSYDMFVSDVAKARNLDINSSYKWANARVFLAKDAKNVGLIDELSDYYSAKTEIEKLSGVSEPIWKEKPKFEKFMDEFLQKNVDSFLDTLFVAKLK
ncbi:signal peptide peptidase SppA [Campylobacter sp.]|uniref:signal peptide peptidase SppA n=1 Tax=Campylobacter sp. TaxID=205 RepID=UPI002709AA0B|nr:signal peptide peptidase SppA [Campylobacter sp.]